MESVKVRNEQIREIIPIYEKVIKLAKDCKDEESVYLLCKRYYLNCGVCLAISKYFEIVYPDWPIFLYAKYGRGGTKWFSYTLEYKTKEENVSLLEARLRVLKQIINKKKITFDL
jgi:flavodoxin